MHQPYQPHRLQRAATSPQPRSPSAIRQTFQGSVTTLSEEVPIRLDLGPEPTINEGPQLTIQVIEAPHGEPMLFTQTPTTATSSRFSFASAESPGAEAEAHITGSWKPRVREPMWEMVSTPSPAAASSAYSDSYAPSSSSSHNRSPSQTTAATVLSDDGAPEPPAAQGGQVQVARQMSVTRAKSTKKFLEPRRMVLNTRSNERLVDRKPLTPTLVELKDRRSQAVQIEGF